MEKKCVLVLTKYISFLFMMIFNDYRYKNLQKKLLSTLQYIKYNINIGKFYYLNF